MIWSAGVDLCKQLVDTQCCFQGRVGQVRVEGRGPAVALVEDALEDGAAAEVFFNPPVQPVHAPPDVPTALTRIESPRGLAPLPMLGPGESYALVYTAEGRLTARIALTHTTPVTSNMTWRASAGPCSAAPCGLLWMSGATKQVTVRFARAGDHPLGDDLPFDLPSGPKGAVTAVQIVARQGVLRCASPGAAGAPVSADETLSWAESAAATLRIDPIVFHDGSLGVEVFASVPPTQRAPAPAPPQPEPPVPEQSAFPSTGLFLLFGVIAALIVTGVLLWLRRRKPATRPVLEGNPTVPVEPGGRKPTALFYSYAPEDKDLRDALEKHLALLKREGRLAGWHDQRLSPGEDAAAEIDARLETADVILLLVSSDYMASDTLWHRQMLRAKARHDKGEAVLIPVLLRKCEWRTAPFGTLKALPDDEVPIMEWPDKDGAFTSIAEGLRGLLAEREAAGAVRAPSSGAPAAQDASGPSLKA